MFLGTVGRIDAETANSVPQENSETLLRTLSIFYAVAKAREF